MNVFCYGTLMYDEVWSRVVRARYRSAHARLAGFRRCEVRGETYPCLLPGKGVVEGRLYWDVCPSDLSRLDRFEGCQYDRIERFCQVEFGPYVPVSVYVWNHEFCDRVSSARWLIKDFEREGMGRFLAAYRGFGRV